VVVKVLTFLPVTGGFNLGFCSSWVCFGCGPVGMDLRHVSMNSSRLFHLHLLIHARYASVVLIYTILTQGTEGHNTAQIGGFVMLPPVVLSKVMDGTQAATEAGLTHLKLTHDSRKLWDYAERYVHMLHEISQVSWGPAGQPPWASHEGNRVVE